MPMVRGPLEIVPRTTTTWRQPVCRCRRSVASPGGRRAAIPDVWIVDSDDEGGVMFGLNFKGRTMKRYWSTACGATVDNIRGNVPLQMACAKAAYDELGLRPWR